MTNREVFIKNFQKYMELNRLKQTDVAKALGVNRATVSAWATGRGYPRADVMQKLANYLNVQMSDLVIESQESETEEERLLSMFRLLSSTGKAKLLERAEELTVLYGGKSDSISDRKVL